MQDDLVRAVRETLVRPRETAREILGRGLSWEAVVLLAAAGIVFDLLFLHLLLSVLPPALRRPELLALGFTPAGVILRIGAFLIGAALVRWVGGLFGGRGDFRRVATAIAWAGFATSVLLAVGFLFQLLLPPLAALADIALSILRLWILAAFIAEAHGFASTARVAGAIVGASVVLALLLILLVAMAGGPVPEM